MIRHLLRFLRWRLLIPRYIYAIYDYLSNMKTDPTHMLVETHELISSGFISVRHFVEPDQLSDIRLLLENHLNKYLRFNAFHTTKKSKPFVNLLDLHDCLTDPAYSCLFDLVFNENILTLAQDYLGNRFCLDSIQLLYSYPTGEKLTENQYWHKDYGAAKSIHVYLPITDMSNESPFYILPPSLSSLIAKLPWVRRIAPNKMSLLLGESKHSCLTFNSGEIIAMEPAISYHRYASHNSHAALFITYNSFPLFYKQDSDVVTNRLLLLQYLDKKLSSIPRQLAHSIIRA